MQHEQDAVEGGLIAHCELACATFGGGSEGGDQGLQLQPQFFANGLSCHEGMKHNCFMRVSWAVVLATLNAHHGLKSIVLRGFTHMSFFRRPDYRSDTTNFINDLKKQKPELEKQQFAGRGLLWDKDVNHEVWEDLRAGRVDQQPYVYQTNHS